MVSRRHPDSVFASYSPISLIFFAAAIPFLLLLLLDYSPYWFSLFERLIFCLLPYIYSSFYLICFPPTLKQRLSACHISSFVGFLHSNLHNILSKTNTQLPTYKHPLFYTLPTTPFLPALPPPPPRPARLCSLFESRPALTR